MSRLPWWEKAPHLLLPLSSLGSLYNRREEALLSVLHTAFEVIQSCSEELNLLHHIPGLRTCGPLGKAPGEHSHRAEEVVVDVSVGLVDLRRVVGIHLGHVDLEGLLDDLPVLLVNRLLELTLVEISTRNDLRHHTEVCSLLCSSEVSMGNLNQGVVDRKQRLEVDRNVDQGSNEGRGKDPRSPQLECLGSDESRQEESTEVHGEGVEPRGQVKWSKWTGKLCSLQHWHNPLPGPYGSLPTHFLWRTG